MKFKGRVRELATVDAQAFRDKVLSLDEEWWHKDAIRQERYEVHKQTQSIVMLFCDGWPNVKIEKRDAWTLLEAEATPIVQQIINDVYGQGGTVLRAVVAKLPPGAKINRHKDSHPSFSVAHRIHIPLKTNDQVVFHVDDIRHQMHVGTAYEINNLLFHEVANNSDEDRIHFIFDYMPPRRRRPAKGGPGGGQSASQESGQKLDRKTEPRTGRGQA